MDAMKSSARTSYALLWVFVLGALLSTTYHQYALIQGGVGQITDGIKWAIFFGILGAGVYMADVPAPAGTLWVWRVGLVGCVVGWLLERFGVAWGVGLQVLLAYPIVGATIYFWLATQFSKLTALWFPRALLNVTLYFGIMGGLTLLAHTVGQRWGAGLALLVNAVLGVIIFTHMMKPLTERNENRSLSANWAILAVCLWLMNVSVPGVLLIFAMPQPSLTHWMREASEWAMVAMLLGMTNQVGMTLHPRHRRISGWLPFWLVAGGAMLQLLGAMAQSVVTLYTLNLETTAFHPFEVLRLFCGMCRTTGIALYTVAFWLRQPSHFARFL